MVYKRTQKKKKKLSLAVMDRSLAISEYLGSI